MQETWLKPNRRALLFGMSAPAIAALLGLLLVLEVIPGATATGWTITGWGLLVLGVLLLAGLAWQLTRPRIAYRNGHVLFFLRSGGPVAVPLDVVEGFLMGQGAAVPSPDHTDGPQTVTVVARLSPRDESWSHVEVNPSLGNWCDSYVTIRGTWCEPLDEKTVRRLNQRLAAAKKGASTK
ncbi:MAG: hypothetical protein WDZ59_11285 [Pirellulales bacterium]